MTYIRHIYDISRLRVKDLHSATYIYVVRRLRVNDHGEDLLEQIITEDETWDFHLFPNTKKHLRAKRFKSHDVKHEVQTWLRGQDPTFYRQGFEKWISRLAKCLNRECDYVEK